ncbi:glutathione reductase [Alcanivorax hongdengensis A-11-3]|uniref:Glutathione reductase n=1 Tax=Alcanivorax hongdengensis A-11-3 TaxID=1177179 RepID=L0WAV2_9GAMM|nr:glutathione-disulfide reductase [Alcanivorax hongdengensis]EKF74096.1 glutathione reductase [Alcanivorax hongdengensis A-11-3]
MTTDFDLVVIGAGSGGVRAARMASSHGARVAIVEERFFGGTCVNVGCVPKKLFSYGAHFGQEFSLAEDFGYQIEGWSFHWPTLRDNKTREIERLNGIYQRILNQAGVTILQGHGRVVGPGQVQVDEQVVTTGKILVAVGGKPYVPDFPGREHVRISDDLFYLQTLPEKVAVVGGGYIATEFAGILHGLGCQVSQIYRRDLFLRGFDGDIRRFVAEQMQAQGVDLRFNTDVQAIDLDGDKKLVTFQDGHIEAFDEVFYATGRIPRLDNLFADAMLPALNDRGAIRVDEQFQTSQDNVYALGDVIGRVELTPVALAEGMWLAAHLFGQTRPAAMDYSNIATAVFSHPNIGTVGLSEEEALEKGHSLRVYRSSFRPMRYTLGDKQERTLIKLVVDDASDRVLGLHMAGEDAPEITQGFAVAMKMGATKADFDATIGIHPTSAEELVTLRQAERVNPS